MGNNSSIINTGRRQTTGGNGKECWSPLDDDGALTKSAELRAAEQWWRLMATVEKGPPIVGACERTSSSGDGGEDGKSTGSTTTTTGFSSAPTAAAIELCKMEAPRSPSHAVTLLLLQLTGVRQALDRREKLAKIGLGLRLALLLLVVLLVGLFGWWALWGGGSGGGGGTAALARGQYQQQELAPSSDRFASSPSSWWPTKTPATTATTASHQQETTSATSTASTTTTTTTSPPLPLSSPSPPPSSQVTPPPQPKTPPKTERAWWGGSISEWGWAELGAAVPLAVVLAPVVLLLALAGLFLLAWAGWCLLLAAVMGWTVVAVAGASAGFGLLRLATCGRRPRAQLLAWLHAHFDGWWRELRALWMRSCQ